MEYKKLYNGVMMPKIGYGVYQISKEDCERCVLDALDVGYRHIDTAQSYFNEEEVGSAIAKSSIDRKEIFITTKIWIDNYYGYENCKKSVEESLRKLKTDYIDLVLLHQPFGDYYGAWRALEELYEKGTIKAIGVSNFYPDRLVDICKFTRIKPMVNQIETNPFNAQKEAHEWLEKYDVAHEAWAPLGEKRNNLFENEVLNRIAKNHNKSVAQIILRWELQNDVIVIPKSTHKERMEENFNILDFSLTDKEIDEINKLDTNNSLFFSHYDPKMVEWFADIVVQRRNNNDHTKEKKNW